MIEFKSLIKINEGYIDINEITSYQQVSGVGWDYVEGKIKIIFYGHEIFGSNVVDDINWFWGGVADGFEDFFEKGIYDVGFPSQAINFTLIKIKDDMVDLEISSKDTVYLRKKFICFEFFKSFFESAISYFLFEKKFKENEANEVERKICLIESFNKKID
ncbi:hypothetical protein [Acinetobacter sp. ESBL14]|uniref:hypothetical protein n=1 Tax=Acinetobacter sp. ESBL14 TaxID=3077329 RepID=UPI002FC91193